MLLLLATLLSFQPSSKSMYARLYHGLSSGQSEKLYTNLADIVYIQIDNTHGSYSKKQAKSVLDKFFTQTKPKGFKLLLDRELKETNRKFSIGHLYTSKGTYKTDLMIKIHGDSYIIQQIRFTKKK